MFLSAETDFDLLVVDVMHEIFGPAENVGRVEDGAGSVSEGVPVRVAARGIGLTDSCVAVADADRSFFRTALVNSVKRRCSFVAINA